MEVLLIGIDLVKKNGKFFQVVEVLPTWKGLTMKILLKSKGLANNS